MQVPSLPQSAANAARPTGPGQVSPPPSARRPLHEALDLTAGGALADIHLNGQVYSLRITRAGKLILTK